MYTHGCVRPDVACNLTALTFLTASGQENPSNQIISLSTKSIFIILILCIIYSIFELFSNWLSIGLRPQMSGG